MNSHETTDPDTGTMCIHHYNVVTAENDMKPQYLSPSKGAYNYANADKLVQWALAQGKQVHGNILTKYSRPPLW
ncbi:endo-1,4-beta-xylanase [Gracilinema caldarium]|uniref:endo-1,4-beta-xylanase n=1 Tax=Gracilinema caldarium TaxID=215591 RepID=UPI00059ECF52|nr:endo-1,4-beta-xylanase [Gracilinema caldarium]